MDKINPHPSKLRLAKNKANPITVRPRSSDPFYKVKYYKNGSLLSGHLV